MQTITHRTTPTITRAACIRRIRNRLLELVDDSHSICDVATRCGILCRGFRHWSDVGLRETFDWLDAPGMLRKTLEARANSYLLGRTEALGKALACDAQMLERDLCQGWDGFSNRDLARFQRELFGDEVTVRGA